jgi:hypothetical protein
MVHELPLLPKQRILAATDPVSVPSSDAPLRTLRRKELVSEGIELKLREADGHLVGTLQVYCSLNRDAVRLARMGQSEAASHLARAAARIEQGAACRRLKKRLEEASVPPDRNVWQHYVRVMSSDAVRPIAVQVAQSVDAARRKVKTLSDRRDILSGYVVDVGRALIEVESASGDERVRLPRAALADARWDLVGAPVSIYLEQHLHHVLYEVEPGVSDEPLDLSETDDIDPFDYSWSASPALTARIGELLAGPGTIQLDARGEATV